MADDLAPLDLSHLGEYRLTVLVGEATAPGGLTRVRLEGTGRLRADQVFAAGPVKVDADTGEIARQGGQLTDRASGELPPEDVAAIMRNASLMPWGQPIAERAAVRSEAVSDWLFQTPTGAPRVLRMWLRDAERDDTVRCVLAEIDRHLYRITNAKIFL